MRVSRSAAVAAFVVGLALVVGALGPAFADDDDEAWRAHENRHRRTHDHQTIIDDGDGFRNDGRQLDAGPRQQPPPMQPYWGQMRPYWNPAAPSIKQQAPHNRQR